MKYHLLILLILVLGATCRLNFTYNNGYTSSRTPKSYKIDLDLPPIERWREFITDNMEGITAFKEYFLSQYKIPSFAFTILGFLGEYHPDKAFIEEMKAISELSNIDKGMIFAINYMYEIFAYCTSIVFRSPDGKVHHGRNLDYDFKDYIGNVSATGEFYKGGKLIHKSTIMAGFVGTHTGVRIGGFGITLNERDLGTIYQNIYQIFIRKTLPNPYIIRKVLEEESHFEDVVDRLAKVDLGAPCYYIISGANDYEGAVIERDREGVHAFYRLDETRWYIVQTNYDRDVPDPSSDFRRVPAEQRIDALGQNNLDELTLFSNVLGLSPNLNDQTLMTVIFSPNSENFNATIWS